jgi:Polyketide cyclase / dehydrase and lipid transport
MENSHTFKRSHSISIKAPAQAVLNYVSNPNSWPEWIAASHEIDSPDRPLVKGDRFREQWHTRSGPAELNWVVTDCDPPSLWIGETSTPFTGKIIVRYDVENKGDFVLFTRSLINPSRPKPPTPEMIKRIDEEAVLSLENIKRNVEAKSV